VPPGGPFVSFVALRHLVDRVDLCLVVSRNGVSGDPAARAPRLLGAAGGAVFALFSAFGFAISPGPSNAGGAAVVQYFATHRTAALWQAVLVGFAAVGFIWFAETFSAWTSFRSAPVVGAAVTAALYLVAVGAWESLGETYGGTAFIDIPHSAYGEAHVLFDVGVGAIHLANFAAAAFVGTTAAAMSDWPGAGRLIGRVGIGLALVQLVNAPFQIAATSHVSDLVGNVVFVAFVGWVLAASLVLVTAIRQSLDGPERPARA
jgi:hypothetical protein